MNVKIKDGCYVHDGVYVWAIDYVSDDVYIDSHVHQSFDILCTR